MRATRDRNGILFFIVPSRRAFAIIGDEGIHQKVGQDFWNKLAAAMSKDFMNGKFNEGLVAGIAECGRLLTIIPMKAKRTSTSSLTISITAIRNNQVGATR